MLIVRPKLEQASANLSTFFCMSFSEVKFRAQSSAKRKSLIVLVLALVFAWNPEVEKGARHTIIDADADFRACKSICQHGREHKAEQLGPVHILVSHQ